MTDTQFVDVVSDDDIQTALQKLRSGFEVSFSQRGIAGTPALDARILVAFACKLTQQQLISEPERLVSKNQSEALNKLSALRRAGTPIARLVQSAEFWSLPFSISKDTLIPRGDSEILIEAALDILPPETARILDIGTGTGCLALTLLHEYKQAMAVGVDINPGALQIAQHNARQLGLAARFSTIESDLFAGLVDAERFNLIISNPPYIASHIIDKLEAEVRLHDPYLALDGGGDGLVFYRRILANVTDHLMPNGHLILEIGYDQKEQVRDLMLAKGFDVRVYYDLAQHPRALVGTIL